MHAKTAFDVFALCFTELPRFTLLGSNVTAVADLFGEKEE